MRWRARAADSEGMPEEPANPVMGPVEARRERVEKGGPASGKGDHLAHAQRAYLYTLHGAAGALVIAVPTSWLVAGVGLYFTRGAGASRVQLIGAFAASVLFWFVWCRALRMFLAGDPAYRVSGRLFVFRKTILPAAMVVGFSGGVLLASRLSSSASGFAPTASVLAVLCAGVGWVVFLTVWRTRSVLSRCDGGRDAVWSDVGALAMFVAAIGCAVASVLPSGGLVAIFAIACSALGLVGALGAALALLRLRSRIGGIMRDMERAEPGPAFEPVGPGS